MVMKITKNELYKVLTVKKAIVVFGFIENAHFRGIIDSLKDSNTGNSDVSVFAIELETYDPLIEELELDMQPTIIAFENGSEKGRIADYNVTEIILDMYKHRGGN